MAASYGRLTLRELKVILKERNARTSGRKAELVERLESYDRNSNFGQQPPIVPDCLDVLVPPDIGYVDITPSVSLPAFDEEAVNNYADMYKTKTSTHTLYENRFLRYLKVCQDLTTFFLRAEVKAEMKKTVTYVVDVVLSHNSEITQAQCECAAGAAPTAHCKHVFVVLQAIADFTKTKTFLSELSKTQTLQGFHRPKSYKGSPVKAENHPTRCNVHELVFDPRQEDGRNVPSYKPFFRNTVINYRANNTELELIPSQQLYLPANMRAYNVDHDYHYDSPSELFLKKIGVSEMDANRAAAIATQTTDQAECKLWHTERQVRITSSNFGTICKATERCNLERLCNSLISPTHFTSKATSHGRRFENVAIKAYENLYQVSVKKCGLTINPNYPYLATTPDGLVGEDTVIEVKCPYVSRNRLISPETVPFLANVNGHLVLKRNHNYYYQVQGQLYLTNRLYCHFIVYTFKDMKVFKMLYDQTFIDEMMAKLDSFHVQHHKVALLKKYFYLNQ